MHRMLVRNFFALRLFVLALAAALLSGAIARAATIAIAPVYVRSYSEGLVPLGELPDGGASTPAGGMLHYEFRMTVDSLMAGDDFWIAIFNVNLGPGLEAVTGWMDPGTAQANELYTQFPSLATYDSNGGAIGGIKQHWQYGNGDFGLAPDDLKSIIVEAAPDEAANRQYGELVRPAAGNPDALGSPTLIGSILVRRIALVDSSISVTPIAGSSWGIYQNNAQGQGLTVAQAAAASFSGGTTALDVPEPSMAALAALGLVALLIKRRRRA